ncbi:MAG: pilus assembly protein [Gammaproteobacteria bacterium]|nr:pilus assembly protein [Gammaproteobacteria bacterium]
MRSSFRTRMSTLVGGMLVALSQSGNAVSIAQMPLFIAAGVTPNVMLVVDNSGSMNNVIWAAGFDPTASYPNWSPPIRSAANCSGTGTTEAWQGSDGNIILSTLLTNRHRGSTSASCGAATVQCPANFVWGQNAAGTVNKCLRLPDPVGGTNTRYNGQYLNWLFQTYASNTDLRGGQIPSDYRMNVARNVATNVVNGNSNLRLGLTRFNTDQGGTVLANCGATPATINAQIATLTASTWTPLAETLYEVTRYFRGMTSQYNAGVAYTSPVLYRCQKSFVIVITDGFPTQDTSFPNNDPADVADTTRSLPNWDGLAPATTAAMYPSFPQYSDGFQAGANTDEGFSLYLDDLAKFAQDIDLRTTGNDATGVSFNATDFPKQDLVTYTVGFAVANQMMADAAEYGTGIYLLANDEAQLTAALQAALSDIEARTSSAASVATNSTRLASDTFIYQARFSSGDWGGQLLAYPIGSDGSIATLDVNGIPLLAGKSGWNAAKMLPDPADRNLYTYDPGAALGSRGRDFLWSDLTAGQRAELDTNPVNGTDDGLGEKRLEYLRGDGSAEIAGGGPFRNRSSKLGDIINSDPTFVGQQNYGFDALPGAEGEAYRTFRQAAAYTNRSAMVYVAANDGMLHGFDALTGVERLAYMPNAVYPQLRYLTDKSFNTNHRLINDGAPRALDAYLNGAWKTVLLGSLGGGGKGVYALDITNPDNFGATNVMWEFTSADDGNMGVAIPQPTIARMYNGDWAAIVPNGYNSGGNATLFILNLRTGAVIREIDTGVGGDNGLSSATPVDVDGDRITDYIYAGDLMGNMWKFDVTSGSESDWAIAFGGAPLYTACSADPCTLANRQPITARPEVGISPPAGYFVYFGTGRYFAVGDNGVGTGANTVYAIRDKNDKGASPEVLPGAGRSTLVQQSVLNEQTIDFDGIIENIRVTTNFPIYDEDDGWYLDLPTTGERQVSNPILRGGRLIFTTVIPSGDECSAGGTSWLMEIDALSGSRLQESPFDLNRDRSFDIDDFAPLDPNDPDSPLVPVSGRQSKQGIIKTPGIVTDDRIEYKYASGSAGGVDTTIENAGRQRGRQSWREIQ